MTNFLRGASTLLPLFFFFVSAIDAQTTLAPTCLPQQAASLPSCLTPFFANFRLTLSTLPVYTSFKQMEESYFDQGGLAAFQTFCQWHQTLYTCLTSTIGDNSIRPCLNENNFQKLTGLNTSDAYAYISDLYIHDYTCTDGYQIATANWACIRSLEQTRVPQIQACHDTLNQGSFSCQKYDTYIGCMQDAFSGGCGNQADLRTYICEIEEIGIMSETYYCDSELPQC